MGRPVDIGANCNIVTVFSGLEVVLSFGYNFGYIYGSFEDGL